MSLRLYIVKVLQENKDEADEHRYYAASDEEAWKMAEEDFGKEQVLDVLLYLIS